MEMYKKNDRPSGIIELGKHKRLFSNVSNSCVVCGWMGAKFMLNYKDGKAYCGGCFVKD